MSSRLPVSAILVAIAVSLLARASEARTADVETWVSGELTAYVATRMQELPRFDDAAVRFVVMENGSPRSAADELSLRLKEQLQRGVLGTPGVRVARQPGGAVRQRLPQSGTDCEADEVQYLVGLETRAARDGSFRVTLRVLDVVENAWVPGFSIAWRGTLTPGQRRAFRRRAVDRTFLGSRGVPYNHTETDLIALHLARDVRCQLMRQVAGEYVLGMPAGDEGGGALDGILPLVRNNIAGVSALEFAVDDGTANAELKGRAHPVDRDLHQYWVTLEPTDAGLPPLGSSVYVRLPAGRTAGNTANEHDSVVPVPDVRVLDLVEVVRLPADRACRPSGPLRIASYLESRPGCLGLRVTTHDDAVVFVLNHQLLFGLVRVGDETCSDRARPRFAKVGEAVTVALPGEALQSDWLPEPVWRFEPDANTYYAIAVSDSKAARALAAHLGKLPGRCTESVRVGVAGRALENWLAELRAEIGRWDAAVDWRAVSISNVY